MGNKLRGKMRLKTKTKRKNIYNKEKEKLSQESKLDHLHGRSAPTSLRHAGSGIVKRENYYI